MLPCVLGCRCQGTGPQGHRTASASLLRETPAGMRRGLHTLRCGVQRTVAGGPLGEPNGLSCEVTAALEQALDTLIFGGLQPGALRSGQRRRGGMDAAAAYPLRVPTKKGARNVPRATRGRLRAPLYRQEFVVYFLSTMRTTLLVATGTGDRRPPKLDRQSCSFVVSG